MALILPIQKVSSSRMGETWMDRVRARMRETGKKQRHLQKALGLGTRGAVGHYLAGRRQPSIEQFAIIAKELNTTVDWLLGEQHQNVEPTDDAQRIVEMYKKLPPFMQTQITLFVEMQCALFDSRAHQFPRQASKSEMEFYRRLVQDRHRIFAAERTKARQGRQNA